MHRKNEGTALLLGVVFAKEQRAKRGQEYRDRVRCEAMENLGYDVRTLDNKHSDAGLDKHCNANFSDTRRMMKSMDAKWNGEKFDHVILDYFFSPVRFTYSNQMYTFVTMQSMLRTGRLGSGEVVGSSIHEDFPNASRIGVFSEGVQDLVAKPALH
jgi:hypothetical protein